MYLEDLKKNPDYITKEKPKLVFEATVDIAKMLIADPITMCQTLGLEILK